jgi:hypothetical protein
MIRPWRCVLSSALVVVASACLLADKALATPVDGGHAPPAAQRKQLHSRRFVETSHALEKPSFSRFVPVEVVWSTVPSGHREVTVRPQLRPTVELDARLIAVAVLAKYLPFQESLSSP